jgi:hypothetical protein
MRIKIPFFILVNDHRYGQSGIACPSYLLINLSFSSLGQIYLIQTKWTVSLMVFIPFRTYKLVADGQGPEPHSLCIYSTVPFETFDKWDKERVQPPCGCWSCLNSACCFHDTDYHYLDPQGSGFWHRRYIIMSSKDIDIHPLPRSWQGVFLLSIFFLFTFNFHSQTSTVYETG